MMNQINGSNTTTTLYPSQSPVSISCDVNALAYVNALTPYSIQNSFAGKVEIKPGSQATFTLNSNNIWLASGDIIAQNPTATPVIPIAGDAIQTVSFLTTEDVFIYDVTILGSASIVSVNFDNLVLRPSQYDKPYISSVFTLLDPEPPMTGQTVTIFFQNSEVVPPPSV